MGEQKAHDNEKTQKYWQKNVLREIHNTNN